MCATSENDSAGFDVLVLEDEPDVADLLKRMLESCGPHRVRVETALQDPAGLLGQLRPQVVFTDLMMPGIDGFEVIRACQALDPGLPVIVVTAHATLDNAVRAVKAGAFDFLAKPFGLDAVELVLAKAGREIAARAREAALRRAVEVCNADVEALLGQSPAMQRIRQWILQVRGTRTNVLIEGESGTGKELVARALHGGQGPFVALNVAAIPDHLAEAELFGHVKGAFTGASRDRVGLIREAHGGTLFLDEINAMSPLMQAKLLRAIQEKRVRPLGAEREYDVDFRLLAAANVSLEQQVAAGQFRRDLYHRVKVLHVRLPALRERREDIGLLAEFFVHRYARAHGRRVRRLSPEALLALSQGDWPGNVRELENVIEQAVILCPEQTLEVPLSVLPENLGGRGWMDPGQQPGRPVTLAEMEINYIHSVLAYCHNNKAEAARLLGIGYKTLLRKLAGEETG